MQRWVRESRKALSLQPPPTQNHVGSPLRSPHPTGGSEATLELKSDVELKTGAEAELELKLKLKLKCIDTTMSQ